MIYYRMNPRYKKTSSGGIYGAEWDGSSTTVWTRTDDAVGLPNPNPYYAGMSGTPSSPFDDISPWKDMVISEDTSAGTVVAIPKFYYKLSRPDNNPSAGLKIQISMSQFDGSSCSPAHMDRGDGAGERDVVYVGRYHCNGSFTSKTGVMPTAGSARSYTRTAIHNLSSNIWQMDFATWFTIWLLYLVEFADWDSQSKIGYGCGNGSSAQNMGYTDSMPYHTGTTQSSKTTYGLGTQYRNIEGLWDNIFDWLDGAYYNSDGLNIILNPANFSDSSGGIAVGVPSSIGYPSAFDVKMVNGTYPVIIPTASNGSDSTFSCDYWYFNASLSCLYGGGSYSQGLNRGLFCVYGDGVSSSSTHRGCRLMILP